MLGIWWVPLCTISRGGNSPSIIQHCFFCPACATPWMLNLVRTQKRWMYHSTGRVVSCWGLTYQVRFSASCKFAVSVSLEQLKAGLACKLTFDLHVVSGCFSA